MRVSTSVANQRELSLQKHRSAQLSDLGGSEPLQIDDIIMSIEECAELLHCHVVTLSLWAKQDRGPPRLTPKGVRKVLYSKRQVLNWLQQRVPEQDPLPPDPP